jgi:hypothetical protein
VSVDLGEEERKIVAQLELSPNTPPPTSGHLPQIHLQTGFSIPEFANVDLGEEERKIVAQLKLSPALLRRIFDCAGSPT